MSLKAQDVLTGSLFNVLTGSFTGLSAAGAITLRGARVGDKVFQVGVDGAPEDDRGAFEKAISVDGEIQQTSSSDLSSYTFDAVLLRAIAVS